MNELDILKKALDRAFPKYEITLYSTGVRDDQIDIGEPNPETGNYDYIFCGNSSFEVIFSHQFAKAFWEDMNIFQFTDEHNMPIYKHIPAWQYHLQLMVLEEHPIKYLEKFL